MSDPMPEPGTIEPCWLCGKSVTLGNDDGPRGWYYWAATGELADGVSRCDGGQPSRGHGDSVLRTLHLPQGRAWMYDVAGNPMSATGEPRKPRRTA